MMDSWKIDEITWNDLAMERVFEKIDSAKSSVGEEYLKKVLQSPVMDEGLLAERSRRAEYLSEDTGVCTRLDKVFQELGKTKKLSLYDYIFRFHEVKSSGNGIHFLLIALLVASIVLIFVKPVIGIIFLVVMFAVNIGSYFRYKAGIESYFMCFKYIVRMLRAASRIVKIEGAAEGPFGTLCETLAVDSQELAPLKRGSFLLTNSVSGSLVDVVMDYVRMLFHVDIIYFNRVRDLAAEKADVIDQLFCTLGEIELAVCVCRYRAGLQTWCRPEFSQMEGAGHLSLSVRDMYHPLTRRVVYNDLDTQNSILLTGSNASGKSTFLKQIAINQILAQTIHTCLAGTFRTGFFRVLSSMALSDNILGNESYFIVEIKSLKRIVDAAADENCRVPVMCFIDEVLRGTNTKERIAASSQILKALSAMNVLCFAATHDIELTQLLDGCMENYHFEERIEGNDVTFDYKLHKGPSITRNAIKLMEVYGFDPAVTKEAFRLSETL